MVNVCVHRDPYGAYRVFCKRAKYKHWHELGKHRETDAAFEQALAAGTVVWLPKIIGPPTLFEK